jgi:hypothetical protein
VNGDPTRVDLAPRTRLALMGLAVVGAIMAAAGAVVAPDRMWASWLLVAYYVLGLGLAGLCFVAIHYTAGASWSAAIRRVPEALAGTLPCAAVLLAVVFIARPQLYPWTSPSSFEASPALAFKLAWLHRPFFLFRAAAYSLIWILFAVAIRRASRRQDVDGDRRWTRANVRLSAAFLIVFGVTFTLASVDWVMSLEPSWYSTIFGVYNFAGLFLSGLAAIIVIALWLERTGPLRNVLTGDHRHDLGKLLFAFSVFWMYIWFSQYMLIWYTNVPEETSYFVRRVQGGWFVLFLANIVLNWLVPFVVLLRRDAKRQRRVLGLVAATLLVGRWLDIYLMIFPAVVGATPRIGVWELGLTAGGLGGFGLVLAWVLRSAPAVPLADPDLVRSVRLQADPRSG